MDTHKYSIPVLPTIQNVLEDISVSNVNLNEKLKIANSDDILHDTYKCFLNCNHLQKDLIRQNKLNNKLEHLNKELVRNIENMKNQQ